jgi:hypothetical protein
MSTWNLSIPYKFNNYYTTSPNELFTYTRVVTLGDRFKTPVPGLFTQYTYPRQEQFHYKKRI